MRLFHVSEESNIAVFNPRVPQRKDLDENVGLVWAIEDRCLPNFLTPRNCPRITYHAGDETSAKDKSVFFTSPDIQHVVIIESKWFEAMKNTCLFLYEFDPGNFELQDRIAGYYVSKVRQIPIAKESGCHKIIAVTSNDNINAIRFYQKRGFDMARFYHNALELSRKIKPSIPLIGENDIPLRHEIEFELSL